MNEHKKYWNNLTIEVILIQYDMKLDKQEMSEIASRIKSKESVVHIKYVLTVCTIT